MPDIPLDIFARVLARWYESEPSKGVAAAITVDVWQAIKQADPTADVHAYYRAINAARDAERAYWENWRADARQRMENIAKD